MPKGPRGKCFQEMPMTMCFNGASCGVNKRKYFNNYLGGRTVISFLNTNTMGYSQQWNTCSRCKCVTEGQCTANTNIWLCWAGVLVQWLWEETHIPKVVGSNPGTVHWMDIFTYICCKNCFVCLKRLKIKTKKRPGRPIFKKTYRCVYAL